MIKKKLLIAVAACSITFLAKAQSVSLFAGSPYVIQNDWLAYSGNTSKIDQLKDSFAYPWGICTDTSGKFWIDDIQKLYLLTGGFSIVRGGYTGSPADPGAQDYKDATGTVSRFTNPHGIFVHPNTNDVYVCDFGNNVIRKGTKFVNQSNPSIWTTVAGVQSFVIGGYKDGAAGSAEFYGPEDMVITSSGVMYVSDQYNHCIRMISGGNVSTIAGDTIEGDANATGKSARFAYPSGLFLESSTSLLVADRNNGKIKRINLSTYQVTTVVSGLFAPTDVVSINGTLYIADHNCIRTWDGSKLRLYVGKYGVDGYVNGSDSTARFGDLALMTYDDRTKSIYIGDVGNNVFRKVPIIDLPVADFAADKVNVLVNDVVKLTNNSMYGQSYQWTISPSTYNLENSSTLTDKDIYVSFSATGSYTVTLKATNPAGSDTKTKSAYINVSVIGSAKPTAQFVADKTGAAVTDTVTMIDQSTNGPTGWQWTFTPSTVTYLNGTTSTSRFPKVKFTSTGMYTIKLVASNSNGKDSLTRTSYVNVWLTSVKKIQTIQANLFPNPAQNSISFTNPYSGLAIVTGMNGQLHSIAIDKGIMNIGALVPGMYFVRFEDDQKNMVFGKFVKLAD